MKKLSFIFLVTTLIFLGISGVWATESEASYTEPIFINLSPNSVDLGEKTVNTPFNTGFNVVPSIFNNNDPYPEFAHIYTTSPLSLSTTMIDIRYTGFVQVSGKVPSTPGAFNYTVTVSGPYNVQTFIIHGIAKAGCPYSDGHHYDTVVRTWQKTDYEIVYEEGFIDGQHALVPVKYCWLIEYTEYACVCGATKVESEIIKEWIERDENGGEL